MKCPPFTNNSINNSYLCEKIIPNVEDKVKCILITKELYLEEDEISVDYINNLTKEYADLYKSIDNIVSKQENDIYSIYTYKDLNCLQETANEAPQIDFKGFDEKIKIALELNDSLIKTIVVKTNDDKYSRSSKQFYFTNPSNGKLLLNISKIIPVQKIEINEDLNTIIEKLDDKNEEFIKFLT